MYHDLDFLSPSKYVVFDEPIMDIADGIMAKSGGDVYKILDGISGVVRNLEYIEDEPLRMKMRRTRTASEIIESGKSSGCCDDGIVLITLARALGIPTRYVETFYEPWLHFNVDDEMTLNLILFEHSAGYDMDDLFMNYASCGVIDGRLMSIYDRWIDFTGDFCLPCSDFFALPDLVRFPNDGIWGHIFVDVFVDGEWRVYDPVNSFTPGNEYVISRGKYVPVGRGLDFSEVYLLVDGMPMESPVGLYNNNDLMNSLYTSGLKEP